MPVSILIHRKMWGSSVETALLASVFCTVLPFMLLFVYHVTADVTCYRSRYR